MSDVERAGRLRCSVDEATLAYWTTMHGVTSLAILGVVKPGSTVVALAREGVIERITRPGPARRARTARARRR
ncbi:MAG TPA: hypothetical protein VIS07_08475 [Candidatus Binatia bacterium]